MAAGNKFDSFVTQLAAGNHAAALNTTDTDVLKVALFADIPLATDDTLADQSTEANGGATSNGYTAAGDDVQNTSTDSSGTITLDGTDIVWTATGNWTSAFRYPVLYNDTQSDYLVLWYDYGSSVNLLNTETFTFTISTNLLTIA